MPLGERSLVTTYWRWDEATGRYTGVEAPAAQPAVTAMAFLEGGVPDGTAPVEGTEVLVCGHGRRDRCCGSLGTSLAIELTAAGHGSRVRVRRTSHTGGHRFAPTAIVLPEGTCWGYLDAKAAALVLGREGPVGQVAPLYRGCMGLPSPEAQTLEREVLRVFGWGLFDRPRRAVEYPDGRVGLDVELPSGEVRSWAAEVTSGRVLPVPDCGEPIQQAKKSQAELVIEGFVELSA